MNKGEGFLKDKMKDYRVDPPNEVWGSISSRLGGTSRRRFLVLALVAAASVALAITLGIHWLGPGPSLETVGTEYSVTPSTDPSSGILRENSGPESGQVPAGKPAAGERQESPKFAADHGPVPGKTVPSNEGQMMASLNIVTQESLSPDEKESFERSLPKTVNEPQVSVSELSSEIESEILAEAPAGDIPEANSGMDAARAEEPAGILSNPEILPEESNRPKDAGWMIGASLSPLYSFRDAEAQYINTTAGRESGTVAYAGGIQAGYRTSRRLAFETGVFYNKMGIDIGAGGIRLLSANVDLAPIGTEESANARVIAIDNTVGNIVSGSGDIYINNYLVNSKTDNGVYSDRLDGAVNALDGIRQHLDYLEIPFNVRYTVVDRGIRLHVLGGMSTNILVNNYVSMEGSEGTDEIGYLTNIRALNYSGNAGIGISYRFLGNFSVSLEPRFRYFLNSVNDASLPTTRPYTFGIYTGLNYLF